MIFAGPIYMDLTTLDTMTMIMVTATAEIRLLCILAMSSRDYSAEGLFTTVPHSILRTASKTGIVLYHLWIIISDGARLSKGAAFDLDSLDDEFLWNCYMINPLILFRSRLSLEDKEALDQSRFLTSAIRGFVLTLTIPPSTSPIKAQGGQPSSLTLVSRLSCRRAGTRFNSRGVDDDGNVANFVETETVFYHSSGLCFSYVQVRGSVPIFWEQSPGLIPGQQKIQITRSPEATQPAFDKHFEHLELTYGAVHILNLLSESKPGEVDLTSRYSYHVSKSPLNQIIAAGGMPEQRMLRDSQFDFHAETKGPGGYEAASAVRRMIFDYAESFAYFLGDETAGGQSTAGEDLNREPVVVLQQEGVFRTNCLDCLDRTNLIQTIISQMALESCFGHRGEHALSDFWMRHSSIWADNGDALSKIYAGTGALKSSFTRHGKMSLAGALADARKSATRMYINNFADKGRQNTIDMLLGRLMDQSPVLLYDPIGEYVNTELERRISEYSNTENINIWTGTFNLNGKWHGAKEDLSAWLCPKVNRLQSQPEIVAVGFQEMVELSPQQIMSTDPARRQVWEEAVGRTLNAESLGGPEEYVLLRSGQLVGAALMIYVKSKVLKSIKYVEGSVKKTGMSGIAGNKGAVAIRMEYANTSICFITAHLAAGFANYEERNRDFRTINHGLRFQRNRSIEDHQSIIWLGDFNYRIGLSDDKVRRYMQAGDLETLYANDQLNLQMVAGRTFPFYSEARITFLPTYKYDIGTDNYDSSEKARIPAWCDRVLRKGDNLRQINYTTAPLRFSDHRPVFATFQCTISRVNEGHKGKLSREIYAKRRAAFERPQSDDDSRDMPIRTEADHSSDHDEDKDDPPGFETVASGLPPASSDHSKWWLANGQPAKSEVRAPSPGAVPNPRRPVNPFTPSPEADWVTVVRPTSTTSSLPEPRSLNKEIFKVPPNAGIGARRPPPPFVVGQEAETKPGESTSAVSSPIHRKPAPPVPKKPTPLVSTATGTSIASPPPQANPPSTDTRTVFPPTSHWTATGGSTTKEAKPPTLPSRTQNVMDEDDSSIRGIAALKPQRRG